MSLCVVELVLEAIIVAGVFALYLCEKERKKFDR